MPFEFKPIESWYESGARIVLPILITQGGTGAITAAGALANLGAASQASVQQSIREARLFQRTVAR